MRTGLDARLLAVACVVSIFTLVPTTRADSPNYGIDAGIGESDNILLTPSQKTHQTMAVTDADFAWLEQSRLFDVDAKATASYLYFLEHAYRPELIGRFDGLGTFAIIPERLSWVAQDNFGQAAVDPFAPLTPNNRENINYFSTGPDLTLRPIGSTLFVDFSARYARAQYEVSPFNSNRFTGSADVGVPLSARSTISLEGTTERVLFDNTLVNVDFDRSSAYVNYAIKGARTGLDVSVGLSRVDQSVAAQSGPLAKIKIYRRLSMAAELTVSGGRDFTDATTGFSTLEGGAVGPITTAPAAVASTNYAATYGSLNWVYRRDRNTVAISGRLEKDSYEAQPQLDLTRSYADFEVGRQLTRTLSALLLGSINRVAYAHVDYTENDTRIGAAITARPGRALEIRLRYDRAGRAVHGIGTGYTENRMFLTIGYRPGKPN